MIKYKNIKFYDEDKEYLKQLYKISKYPEKINILSEFYKYHVDVPRFFMLPTSNIMNNFHD